MNDKELKQSITGNQMMSNILIFLTEMFGIAPLFLMVFLFGKLVEGTITTNTALIIIGAMLLSYILKAVFSYLGTKLVHDMAYSKLMQLRLTMIEKLKGLNLGFFKKNDIGRIANILERDVEQVELYLAHSRPDLMTTILVPILIFIVMLFIDFRLALAMAAGLPIFFIVLMWGEKRMGYYFGILFGYESKVKSELMDYVKNISTIKAFSKEEKISEGAYNATIECNDWNMKTQKGISLPTTLMEFSVEIGIVATTVLGIILLSMGEIEFSEYILANILVGIFTSVLNKIGTTQHFAALFDTAVKSMKTILTAKTSTDKKADNLTSGDIVFENVDFSYENNAFAIKDTNLVIKENSFNAFVGGSGSGKSTITNLIMGFFDVNNGKITINGKNIAEYSQDSISAMISTVSQEVMLFNMSVYENIAMGKENATKEEVIYAAKKARCHDFITSLPKGYDTVVGEMGIKFSGGEKQRISIARMILKNAPIVILDEAFAALDTENEKLVAQAIEEISKDKTVISVAHNLNSIMSADQIFMMDTGEIIGRGTHSELMEHCKEYSQLVTAQQKVDSWKMKEVI